MALDLEHLRNIGIIAHIDAGKTTVTEAILFVAGVERRMGRIDDGNTVMDYLPEERERGITITSAATTFTWKKHTITLIDTPGHVDFTAEVERSLRVLDGAIVVFCGVAGVEAQSETVWRRADSYNVPRISFINKLDRVGADFNAAVESIKERLDACPVPIQFPIGLEKEHRGVVDLVRMVAFTYPCELSNKKFDSGPVPAEIEIEVDLAREQMLESLANCDDILCEKYLDGLDISEAELVAAIRRATLANTITPVLCGSGLKNTGIPLILDAVIDYLPSPKDLPPIVGMHPTKDKKEKRRASEKDPLAALAFKLIADKHADLYFLRIYSGKLKSSQALYNPRTGKSERIMRLYRMHADNREQIESAGAGEIVAVAGFKTTRTGDTLCIKQKPIVLESMDFPNTVISMAIEPRSVADRDKLAEALDRMALEDPTFTVRVDEETAQTVISGMGELHLEVIKNRLLSDFKIDANVGKPRVAYRQTIEAGSTGISEFVRQTPTRRQFAYVELKVEPDADTRKPKFTNTVSKELLPLHLAAAAEEGALGATQGGAGYGFPIINIKITMTDAQYHHTDSSEISFNAAGALAFRDAIEKATVIILEPRMRVEVQVPEESLGEILNDLTARKADINEVEARGKLRVVKGFVSLEKMFGYATAVRSLSQGRAQPSMELHKYAPVGPEVYERFNF